MRVVSRVKSYLGVPLLAFTVAVLFCSIFVFIGHSSADVADEGFSLQVSPSPLVATVKPGTSQTLDLQIRNTNSTTQALKMGLRSFSIAESNGQIELGKEAPPDIQQLVRFSSPVFTVEAGQLFTQHITINTPKSAGFTYTFAVTISQQNAPKGQNGTSSIQGSVAVFTLLTVDKPGAVRKLEITKLSVSKHVYEYLPATVSITFKNIGNTLGQPKGTIFIQRHNNDKVPLATLDINDSGGYILPGSSRTISASWDSGFPHYETTNLNGASQQKLVWDGGNLSNLRFGRYEAKVVAVYDDGSHDVPLDANISFWVIPWRMLAILIAALVLITIGIVTTVRKSTKALRPLRSKKPKSDAKSDR
ncbi:MAG: hypothetical protein ABI220_04425 [Candidatus Saccharimonadales bacterium]